MYREDYNGKFAHDRADEDVYSKPVRAGKRTYFFDVKATKNRKDFYLTITESKLKNSGDGRSMYDKHKIFLYKEDFEKFADGFKEALDYIRTNCLEEGVNYEQTHTERFRDEEHDLKANAPEREQDDEKRFTDVNFDEF